MGNGENRHQQPIVEHPFTTTKLFYRFPYIFDLELGTLNINKPRKSNDQLSHKGFFILFFLQIN